MSISFSIFEVQRTLLALPALDPGAWGELPPVHAPRRSSCRLPPVVLAACCCVCVAALKLLYLHVKENRKNAIPSIPECPLENCRRLRTQNACRGSGKWRCGLLGFFLPASFLVDLQLQLNINDLLSRFSKFHTNWQDPSQMPDVHGAKRPFVYC